MEYDLGAAAALLRESHPKLAGQIQKCKDLGSVCLDLEAGGMALQALGDVMMREANAAEDADRSAYALAGRALFAEALVKYTRIYNSQDGRKLFNHDAADARQKAAHTRLMQLRNRGVAHYNPRGLDDASFLEDRFVAALDPRGTVQFAYPFRRYNYREEDVRDLVELLLLAAQQADRQRLRAEAELGETLEILWDDPKVREAINICPFDAAAFHDSAEAAEAVKAGGQVHSFQSSQLT